MATTILIAIFSAMLLAQLIYWGVLLRLSVGWAKSTAISWRNVIRVTVGSQLILGLPFALLRLATYLYADSLSLFVTLIASIICIAVTCSWIGQAFQLGQLRSLQAWFTTTVLSLTLTIALALLFRASAFEAFAIPTNSMAPTVVGQHIKGTCPTCGTTSFTDPQVLKYVDHRSLAICENFHTHRPSQSGTEEFAGDRILAAKFMKPKRWDLIVFRVPSDPKTNYLKRLVGLPGEKLYIDDGSLWINDQRMKLPDHLKGLRYEIDPHLNRLSSRSDGTKDNPIILGNDELFVLGDFSKRAFDSRYWQSGAAGYPNYAVPESHVIGVASHTYWPPERWRILK